MNLRPNEPTALEQVAPRIALAVKQRREEQWRGISRCWQNHGYHVYGAGPCFDTLEQAVRYRDGLDRDGITWRPQR